MTEKPDNQSVSPWIVSPAFDLCFVINIWWVVLSLPFFAMASGDSPLTFWQIYFLTTPHRWLTLFLVASDPDRRGGRGRLFLALAIIFALIVCGTRTITGAFLCLALVDYIWNAWHFASQHGGILRIYSRKCGGGRPNLERRIMRVFITYVPLRLAGWTTGWTEAYPAVGSMLPLLDLAVLALPVALLVLELIDRPFERVGKVLYLVSVTLMYGALLLAVRNEWRRWMVVLAPANAAFHAIEYMAIVTFYAQRRESRGSEGLFQTAAQNWLVVLLSFIVVAGVVAGLADRMTGIHPVLNISLEQIWAGANLWAAFLHYAYDGMIWKLRRPETAKTLGVEVTS